MKKGFTLTELLVVVVIVIIIAAVLYGGFRLFSGSQMGARSFGGVAVKHLPKGRKLVNVTWKQDDLWIVTRAALDTEAMQTYEFQESSNFGILEGKVTIIEER